MANSFIQLHYHCVFSTKNREHFIAPAIETRIWAIVAEAGVRHRVKVRRIGGIANHIHVLCDIPTTISLAEAMKGLKGGSSRAINRSGLIPVPFGWQDGYAAFTVSKSALADVSRYIANQAEHHKTMSFEAEYTALLERHGIEYDPSNLWD